MRSLFLILLFAIEASAQSGLTCPVVEKRGSDALLRISSDLQVSILATTNGMDLKALVTDRETGTRQVLERSVDASNTMGDLYVFRMKNGTYQQFLKAGLLRWPSGGYVWAIASLDHPDVAPFLLVDLTEIDGSGIQCLPPGILSGLIFGDFSHASVAMVETQGNVLQFAEAASRLARLPHQARSTMTSSADINGGNSDGFDNSQYLRTTGAPYVLLDEENSGILTHAFLNPQYPFMVPNYVSSNFSFFLNGETSPSLSASAYSLFTIGQGPFLPSQIGSGEGGFWAYLTMPFRDGLRLESASATFHHFVVQKGLGDSDTEGWDRLLPLVASSGGSPHGAIPALTTLTQNILVPAQGSVQLPPIQSAGVILKLALQGTMNLSEWKYLRIRATFDQHATPDIDLPLCTFFGACYPSYSVQSAMWQLAALPGGGSSGTTYFPMPFDSDARIELVNLTAVDQSFSVDLDWLPGQYPKPYGYFRADYREGMSSTGVDFTTASRAGYGKLVAEVIEPLVEVSQLNANFNIFEGDERIYVDGEDHPSHHGTSHENIANWGWYGIAGFDQPFSRSTHGYSGPIPSQTNGVSELWRSFYRQRLFWDPVYYYQSLESKLEHGPSNDQNAYYRTAFFFYESDKAAPMVIQDELEHGSSANESQHALITGTNTSFQNVQSTFTGDSTQVATSKRFLVTQDPFRFRLNTANNNFGGMLRFTLERFGNGSARAKILVNGHEVGTIHQPWDQRSDPQAIRFYQTSIELPYSVTHNQTSLGIEVIPLGPSPWRQAQVKLYSYFH